MYALAIQSQIGDLMRENESDLEEQKRVVIAEHHRVLQNNFLLLQDGDIEPEEYYRLKYRDERQIAYWEARTSDPDTRCGDDGERRRGAYLIIVFGTPREQVQKCLVSNHETSTKCCGSGNEICR